MSVGVWCWAVVCADGTYFRYLIDPNTGVCTRDAFHNFLEVAED